MQGSSPSADLSAANISSENTYSPCKVGQLGYINEESLKNDGNTPL